MNGYNNYNNQNNNYRAGKFINPYFTQNQNASYNKNGFFGGNNNGQKKKIKIALILSVIIILIFTILFLFILNRKSHEENNEENNNNNEIIVKHNYVGTKDFGYVDVPTDWIRVNNADDNTIFQYSDPTGQYVVSIKAYSTDKVQAYSYASSIYKGLQNEGVIEELAAAMTTVKEFEAYQVYGYYRQYNKDLIIWVFEDGQGKTHYLSLEGGDDIEKYLGIIDSFVLTY